MRPNDRTYRTSGARVREKNQAFATLNRSQYVIAKKTEPPSNRCLSLPEEEPTSGESRQSWPAMVGSRGGEGSQAGRPKAGAHRCRVLLAQRRRRREAEQHRGKPGAWERGEAGGGCREAHRESGKVAAPTPGGREVALCRELREEEVGGGRERWKETGPGLTMSV